ncbi:MAG: neutral zinc metallopeptidase [Nakamurella sp.]
MYAFYCPPNRTIYINTSLLRLWDVEFTRPQVPYSLSMTLAHEVGHAVQALLDPSTETEVGSHIELQADCLAGVWAQHAIDRDGLDRATPLTTWRKETELLNTPDHELTHGTPDQRLAATRKGMDGGSAAACGLPEG